eukprot:jgi/Bigna1/80282/fgenesh1_pg.69_\
MMVNVVVTNCAISRRPALLTSFSQLLLPARLLACVASSLSARGGGRKLCPTPIQSIAIPMAMSGASFAAVSPSGYSVVVAAVKVAGCTGKTLSYALATLLHVRAQLQRTSRDVGSPIAIIACPTRQQIEAVRSTVMPLSLSLGGGLAVAVAMGTDEDVKRRRALERRFKDTVHVAIGTVGKLVALAQDKLLSGRCASFLVMDDADLLLNVRRREPFSMALSQYVHPNTQIERWLDRKLIQIFVGGCKNSSDAGKGAELVVREGALIPNNISCSYTATPLIAPQSPASLRQTRSLRGDYDIHRENNSRAAGNADMATAAATKPLASLGEDARHADDGDGCISDDFNEAPQYATTSSFESAGFLKTAILPSALIEKYGSAIVERTNQAVTLLHANGNYTVVASNNSGRTDAKKCGWHRGHHHHSLEDTERQATGVDAMKHFNEGLKHIPEVESVPQSVFSSDPRASKQALRRWIGNEGPRRLDAAAGVHFAAQSEGSSALRALDRNNARPKERCDRHGFRGDVQRESRRKGRGDFDVSSEEGITGQRQLDHVVNSMMC